MTCLSLFDRQIKVWLFSMGFTLGYGALFCKIWSVYRLATNRKKEAATSMGAGKGGVGSGGANMPHSWEVYLLLTLLLAMDITILTVWQWIDPLYSKEENFALEEADDWLDDIKYWPYLKKCEARHMNVWLGLCFGWKGLLLMFGLLLAYETRNVKMKIVSDSRFAGESCLMGGQ